MTSAQSTPLSQEGYGADTPTSPKAWIVEFDLPYFVSIGDSWDDAKLRGYAEALDRGEAPEPVPFSPRLRPEAAFILAGAKAFHLPDPNRLDQPFDVPVDEGRVRLEFLRRLRNLDRTTVMVGEMRPDRGAASFTTVRARTDASLTNSLGRNDLAGAAEAALEAANLFLEQYRYVAGAFWAYAIGKADIAEFRIWREMADGRLHGPSVHLAPGGGPLIGPGASPLIYGEVGEMIRGRLARGVPQPLWAAILDSALDHAHRGRYRNAVVDAAAAFEAFVGSLLRSHFASCGRSEAELEAVLVRDDGSYRGIKEVAKDVVRSELTVDFGGTAEFRDWVTNVADPRNWIVHGRIADATEETAARAVRDAKRAIAKLSALVGSLSDG